MATVKQFRFFGYGNEDNYDGGNSEKGVTYNSLVSGDLFFYNNYKSAKQLGIQTIPGAKFCLGGKDQNYEIIVGKTGIYELNTEKLGISINGLSFSGETVEMIDQNPNAYLIVDIIYS